MTVEVYLQGEGTDGSTTVLDSSSNAYTIGVGTGAEIDTALKQAGSASIQVRNSGYLDIAEVITALGTAAWCVEAYHYIEVMDGAHYLFYAGDTQLYISYARKVVADWYDRTTENYEQSTGTGTAPTDEWFHFAVTYDGTHIRGFLNGTEQFETAADINEAATYWLLLSASSYDDEFHTDEYKITLGDAVYTESFTPGGGTTVEAVASADITVTTEVEGRGLPYGLANIVVSATAVGRRTQVATASASIAVSTGVVGFPKITIAPLPISIFVRLPVYIGLPIRIAVYQDKSGISLPINVGRYPVTKSLPIRIDVWQDKSSIALPITIYGDLSTAASDTIVLWRPKAVLDGSNISSKLIQAQEIEFEEDGSPIASIAFVPAAGTVDPLCWVGKALKLYWQRMVNNVATNEILAYTGIVSDPEWLADDRTVAISATGDLQTKLDAMDKTAIASTIGGTFSEYIFGDPTGMSGWDYAQALMSTQASTLWQDQSGAIRVTACAAKASADYTWTEAELLERAQVVRYAGRQDMVNTIYTTVAYRYDALRQRNVTFNFAPWQLTTPSMFISGNEGGWELPQRTQIESAANGGGWVLIGDITYTDVWPNGIYSTYSDFGNPMLEGLSLSDEYKADYCIAARWKAARRWVQNWTENYTFTVQASESVATVGVLATDESYAIEDPAKDDTWESNEEFTGYKSGSTIMPNGLDRVYRLDTFRADVETAQAVALAKAQADILKAHRGTTVTVTLPFQPNLSLADTVEIDTAYLECKGKVRRIRHRWDIDTGECSTEVDIALSRHNGAGLVTSDPLTPPSEPADPDETEPGTYHTLLMHIGGQDDRAVWDEDWDGYVTNVPFSSADGSATIRGGWNRNPANPALTGKIYEEGFHVLPPTIDSEYADPVDFTTATVYDTAIPQDPLVLISG